MSRFTVPRRFIDNFQDRGGSVAPEIRFVAFYEVSARCSPNSEAKLRTWKIEGYGPTVQAAQDSCIENVELFLREADGEA